MMYINIKKLYSWRIRLYKIPSFFFSLLFPFFSLFSSFFFFPPSSPLFPFFPPHGVRVCPSFGAECYTLAYVCGHISPPLKCPLFHKLKSGHPTYNKPCFPDMCLSLEDAMTFPLLLCIY